MRLAAAWSRDPPRGARIKGVRVSRGVEKGHVFADARGAEEGNGYVNWSRYTFDFLPPPLAGRGRPRDGDSLSILYER